MANFRRLSGRFHILIWGVFHLGNKIRKFQWEKNGFSDRQNVVPFDRKPWKGAEPVTQWDTKMASELVTTETGIKYEKRVHSKWNTQFRWESSSRENGSTFLDFPLFPGIFQWDVSTKRFPFSIEPKFSKILTKWKAPLETARYGPKPGVSRIIRKSWKH